MPRLKPSPHPLFQKLTAAFAAAAVVVAVVAAVCVGALREEAANTQLMVEEEMQMMLDLGEFQSVLQQKGMAALYVLTNNPKWRLGVTQGRTDFDKWVARTRGHATDPERSAVLDEMVATYGRYDAVRAQALAFADEGRSADSVRTLEESQALATTLLSQSQRFTTLSTRRAHVRLADSLANAGRLGLWLLLLAALAATGSLAMGFAVARSLARPIYELQVKIADLTEMARVEVGGSTSLEHMGEEVAAVMAHLEKTNALLLEQRRRLIQTEKLSAMGELTAKLAHQVLNPLAGMKAAVQGLARRREVDATVVASTAAALAQEVGRVEELLRRMMQYSRPLAPHPQMGTMEALLQGVADGAAHSLPEGTPRVHVTVGGGIPPLEVDPVLMNQAITNLVINAAQVNPPDTAVEIRASMAPDNRVTVDVLDRGPGLPADAMDQLFKPFFTTKPKGHGLGLAVSYNIVVEHGGTLTASNRDDGPGAQFRVTLPRGQVNMRGLVWVADDEDLLRTSLVDALREEGLEVEAFPTRAELRRRLTTASPDVLLLDVQLGNDDGLQLMADCAQSLGTCKVVIITAHGSVERAVKAMRQGAYDFIRKPFDLEEVITTVKNAARTLQLEANVAWHARADRALVDDAAAPPSAAMKKAQEELRIMAQSPVPLVLLLGESGSGKQVMARLFHQASPRAAAAFVELNCSALPDTLIESELFGHERGAFSDAKERKLGLVEVAEGGTLFLDEVGDLGAGAQAKLLTFLEQHTFRRVGSTTVRKVDVRVVAATNRDLTAMVADGRFRQDLLYRLNAMTVRLPPLRDRREDIPVLAQQFLLEFARSYGRRWTGISPDAMRLLCAWHWPGNVRELRGVISRATLLHDDVLLQPAHLPSEIVSDSVPPYVATGQDLRPLREVEDQHIRHVLEQCKGNRTLAAEHLGITRQTLARRLGLGQDDPEA